MNRWPIFTAMFLLITLVAVGQQANEKTSRNKDLQEIERLEIEWNWINEVSDPEAKGRLLADDSYHVGPSGRTYTREQDIAAARTAAVQNHTSNSTLRFIITDKRIRLYKDVAVVTATGVSIRTAPDGQKKMGSPFRAIHVWEKRSGQWLLVVDQVTPIRN